MAPRSSNDSYTPKRETKHREGSKRRRSRSQPRYHAREYYEQPESHRVRRSTTPRYQNVVASSRRQSRGHYSDSTSSKQSVTPRTRHHRRRSYTRSPSSSSQRRGTREHPLASRCIGVFGLNTNTSQHKIRELFSKFGPIERIQMVIDAHTGRSRGFCFIYFESLNDAKAAKDACSGIEVDDRRIRVDYSITQRAHTPTPGIYMGRPSKYAKRAREVYRMGGRRNSPSSSYYRNEREREYRRSVRYDRSKTRSRTRSRSPRRNARY